MSITLGVHSALAVTSAAFFYKTNKNTVLRDVRGTPQKRLNDVGGKYAGAYIVSTTIAACARVASACNLLFAIISPTTRAAKIGFEVAKWTISVLWGAGIMGAIYKGRANNWVDKYMTHGETVGQAAAAAITVGLAIAHVIGPVGIIIGLVGPALYFCSLAFPVRIQREQKAQEPPQAAPQQPRVGIEI